MIYRNEHIHTNGNSSQVFVVAVIFFDAFPYGHGHGQGQKFEVMLLFGKYLIICNIQEMLYENFGVSRPSLS